MPKDVKSPRKLLSPTKLIMTNQCLPSERLFEGKTEFGDCGDSVESLPAWFNLELARKGQEFARERLYGVFYSHLIALFFLLAQRDTAKILYYTQKSETGEKALVRYLATLNQVRLWYDAEISEDPSCPFFTSLRKVRMIHRVVGQRLQSEHPDISQPMVVEPEENKVLLSHSHNNHKLWVAFKKDLASSKLADEIGRSKSKLTAVEETPDGFNYFSQFQMTLTQWSFVALPVIYPDHLGLYDVTEEELEGFIHLWALIAHTLGIKPEYNICLVPDVKAFKDHANWLNKNYFIPGFFDTCYETEIMWSALGEGVSEIYPILKTENVLLQLLEDYIGVRSENFRQHVTWAATFRRLLHKLIVRPLLQYRWFQQRCNLYVREMAAVATKRILGLDSRNDVEISQKAFYF